MGGVPRMKGLKLDGYTFKQNDEDLNLEDFLKLIESVGLEFGGNVKQVDEEV